MGEQHISRGSTGGKGTRPFQPISFDDLPPRDKLRAIRDSGRRETLDREEQQRRRAVAVMDVLKLQPAEREKIDIFRTVPVTGRGDNIDQLVNTNTRPEFPLTEVFVTFPNERSGNTDIISVRMDALLQHFGQDPSARGNLTRTLDRSARPSNETPADRLSRIIFEIKFMDALISGQKKYAEAQTPTQAQQVGQVARVTPLMEDYNVQKSALVLEYLKTVGNLAKKFPDLAAALIQGQGSDANHQELRMGYLTENGKVRYLYQPDTQPELEVSRDSATTEINVGKLKQDRNNDPSASDYAKVAERICKILRIP